MVAIRFHQCPEQGVQRIRHLHPGFFLLRASEILHANRDPAAIVGQNDRHGHLSRFDIHRNAFPGVHRVAFGQKPSDDIRVGRLFVSIVVVLCIASHAPSIALAEPPTQDRFTTAASSNPSAFAAVGWAHFYDSPDGGRLRSAGNGWAFEAGMLWRTGGIVHIEGGVRAAWVGDRYWEWLVRSGARVELWPQDTQDRFTVEARGGLGLGFRATRLDDDTVEIHPTLGPHLGLGLRTFWPEVVMWFGMDAQARMDPLSTWLGALIVLSAP